MENQYNNYSISTLLKRFPKLKSCEKDIDSAFKVLLNCFSNGNKLLVAGNGGSCSDANHICGELLKGFKKQRKLDLHFSNKLKQIDPILGDELSLK